MGCLTRTQKAFTLTSNLCWGRGGGRRCAALVAFHCGKVIQCDQKEATQGRRVYFGSPFSKVLNAHRREGMESRGLSSTPLAAGKKPSKPASTGSGWNIPTTFRPLARPPRKGPITFLKILPEAARHSNHEPLEDVSHSNENILPLTPDP